MTIDISINAVLSNIVKNVGNRSVNESWLYSVPEMSEQSRSCLKKVQGLQSPYVARPYVSKLYSVTDKSERSQRIFEQPAMCQGLINDSGPTY